MLENRTEIQKSPIRKKGMNSRALAEDSQVLRTARAKEAFADTDQQVVCTGGERPGWIMPESSKDSGPFRKSGNRETAGHGIALPERTAQAGIRVSVQKTFSVETESSFFEFRSKKRIKGETPRLAARQEDSVEKISTEGALGTDLRR